MSVSGFTVTFPVAPSILATTFWRTVSVAPRETRRSGVERVDHAGPAGDSGDHLAPLPCIEVSD